MKVIKDNTGNNIKAEKKMLDVLKIHCSECGSELEITKDDTHIGWLGAAFINCPCCGQESMVDEMDGITLTIDNIEFPVHFHRTDLELGNAKEVSASEIKKEIQRGVEHFRNNKDAFCWYTSYGDLFLVMFRYPGDEEYWVVVTKDFYETCIPFEKEDYEK